MLVQKNAMMLQRQQPFASRQPVILERQPVAISTAFLANRKLESNELCKTEPGAKSSFGKILLPTSMPKSNFGGKREKPMRSSFGGRRSRMRRARSITRRRRLRDLISRSKERFLRISFAIAMRRQYARVLSRRVRGIGRSYLGEEFQSSAFKHSRRWKEEINKKG